METSHTVSPGVQGGLGPASATIGYQYQRKEERTTENRARLTGAMRNLVLVMSLKNTQRPRQAHKRKT